MRSVSRTRVVVWSAVGVAFLAGVGAGVPAVMAGVRSAPPESIPKDWPAAKASRMQAEDQLRQAAAGRPLLPPPALPTTASPANGKRLQQQDAGPEAGTSAAGGQAGFTPGIVPLADGGPFSPSQFLGTNLWNGLVGGKWEVVQAGGVPVDRSLGAASPDARAGLFIYTRSPDPASGATPHVIGVRSPSPAAPDGMFTVRGVSGDILSLSLSGSAKVYSFNVVTLRFAQLPAIPECGLRPPAFIPA